MKKRSSFHTLISISLIMNLFTWVFMPCQAHAQTYTSQLGFLEQFAIKLYNTGDTAQASKEFQRILRIDPENQVAFNYLKKIFGTTPVISDAYPTSMDKADLIASSIRSLKDDITKHEHDMSLLESMIRNLITENDHLYMSLNKRSREVMTLREKLYGIPYAKQYLDVMGELPYDRIPQNLYRPDKLSAANFGISQTNASASIDQTRKNEAEMSYLIKEIEKYENALTSLRADAAQGAPTGTLNKTLEKKRLALMDKILLLEEKKKHLEAVKTDLSSINSDLKTSNGHYLQLLDKIDRYYADIKKKIAQKNFVEQRMFSDLMVDYARKSMELATASKASAQAAIVKPTLPAPAVIDPALKAEVASLTEKLKDAMLDHSAQIKELAQLKTSISAKETSLAKLSATIAAQDKKINDINLVIKEKDQQLQALRDKLAESQKELSQKDKQIKEQQGTLEYTHQTLNTVNLQVKTIQKLLKESDEDLEALSRKVAQTPQKGTASTTTRIPDQATVAGLRTPQNTITIEALEKQLADLQSQLKKQDQTFPKGLADQVKELRASLTAKDKNVRELKDQSDKLQQQLKIKERELADTQTQLSDTNAQLSSLRKLAMQKSVLDHSIETKINALKNDAEQRTSSFNKQQKEITQIRETLARAEQENKALESSVKEKDSRIRDLSAKITALEKKSVNTDLNRNTFEDEALELKEQLAAKNKELQDLQIALKDKSADLDLLALTKGPKAYEREREILHNTLAEYDQNIQDLQRDLLVRDQEISQLKNNLNIFKNKVAKTELLQEQKSFLSRELEKISKKLEEQEKAYRLSEVQRAMLSGLLNEQQNKTEQANNEAAGKLLSIRTELRDKELDLTERDQTIARIKENLDHKTLALKEAEDQLKLLEEKLLAFEGKQQAVRGVVDKRDDEISVLSQEIAQLKQQLNVAEKNAAMTQEALKDASANNVVIQQRIRDKELERTELNVLLDKVRNDLKTAHQTIKNRDQEMLDLQFYKEKIKLQENVIEELRSLLDEKDMELREAQKNS